MNLGCFRISISCSTLAEHLHIGHVPRTPRERTGAFDENNMTTHSQGIPQEALPEISITEFQVEGYDRFGGTNSQFSVIATLGVPFKAHFMV